MCACVMACPSSSCLCAVLLLRDPPPPLRLRAPTGSGWCLVMKGLSNGSLLCPRSPKRLRQTLPPLSSLYIVSVCGCERMNVIIGTSVCLFACVLSDRHGLGYAFGRLPGGSALTSGRSRRTTLKLRNSQKPPDGASQQPLLCNRPVFVFPQPIC